MLYMYVHELRIHVFHQAVPPLRGLWTTGIWNRASTTTTPGPAVAGSVLITHRYSQIC